MSVLVTPAGQYGDVLKGNVVRFKFNTHQANGTPITLAGTPAIKVYKDNETASEIATGITLTVDLDGLTGMHQVDVDTDADALYEEGSEYHLVITTGTVDGVSAVGAVVGSFSIAHRSNIAALPPQVLVSLPIQADEAAPTVHFPMFPGAVEWRFPYEATGVMAADVELYYRRKGDAAWTDYTSSLNDLSAPDDAWNAGGFILTSIGQVRLDLPAAAVAAGAELVELLFVYSQAGQQTWRCHMIIPITVGDPFDQLAALLDGADAAGIDGINLRKLLRLMASALLGKNTGTVANPTFRDLADTKDRVTVTQPDRSVITLDGS